MLTSIVVAIVRTCTRFATLVVIVSLLLAVGASYYAAQHFAINTDINKLISPDLDWRKRDNQFEHAFDREKLILAVVEAPTPELASAASTALAAKLAGDTTHFESVQPLGSGEFFEKNGLLFLPVEEVGKVAGQLEAAAPLIEIMAGDPSIRGLTGALETGLAGVKRGQVKLDNTERPFNLISQTVEDILNKGTATFSWRELVSDKPLTDTDRRAFIEFKPKLDYSELEPGKDATDAIRKAATDLNFAGQYSARVRLTGPVPIANEEYSTVQDGAILNGVVTVLIVLVILWMALHSGKIIFAVFVNLFIGLVADDRGRPDDGGIAEPAVDRLCRAVRRPRRRFRHPVQRPLPFRAFQERRSGAGAGERGQTFGGAAVARRDGDRRRLPVFPADRLQGHFRTRQDRRRRHADRVHHQHHGAACHAEAASPARRKRAGRLRVSGAGGRIPRKASRHHRRWHAASRRGRPAAALFHEVRLQPDQPAQSEG